MTYQENKFSDWSIGKDELKAYFKESEFPVLLREFIVSTCTIYRNKAFPDSPIMGILKKEIMPSTMSKLKVHFLTRNF